MQPAALNDNKADCNGFRMSSGLRIIQGCASLRLRAVRHCFRPRGCLRRSWGPIKVSPFRGVYSLPRCIFNFFSGAFNFFVAVFLFHLLITLVTFLISSRRLFGKKIPHLGGVSHLLTTPSIALFFEWVTGRTSYVFCGVCHVQKWG